MAEKVSRLAAFASCVLLLACGDPAPQPEATPSGSDESASAEGSASPTYEQSFVFVSVNGDSVFLVPWLLRTTVQADTVAREAHGWLARGRIWDAFFSARWTTPATRSPARILPYGNMRLLVQEGDVVDGIIYEQGARHLELALGESRRSWGGPRGEAIELLRGAAYLSDERVDGLILHMARAASGDVSPGGDWALLASGDSIVVVLAADQEHGVESDPVYRAWAEVGDEERIWTEVAVQWSETQAFPPARRDVPVAWRFLTEERQLQGAFEAVSSDIEPGSGPGPLLPVRALYEVAGDVTFDGRRYPVRGLFVHERR